MPYVYGDRISEVELDALLTRLRARGSTERTVAAETISRGVGRDPSQGTSAQTQAAILIELREWDDLDETAHGLAKLGDRLSGPQRGLRII
jgi:hypothetical protein